MTLAPPVDIGSLIWRPEWRHGRACIAGTGISVAMVAVRYRRGESADQIAADYPDVPESHFFAAIAYYLANRELIDAELAQDNALWDQIERFSDLVRRLTGYDRRRAAHLS